MKICEDCIKQDVCKFKKEVEKYEGGVKLPKPLKPNIGCECKRTEPSNYTYITADNKVTYTGDWIYPPSGTDCVPNDCTLTAFNDTFN